MLLKCASGRYIYVYIQIKMFIKMLRCSSPGFLLVRDAGGGPKATPAQRGFRDALIASQEPSAGVPEQQDGKRWGG